MKRKSNWVNKLLKIIIVALVILLILLLLRDFQLHKLSVARNLDRTNQTIHTLQTEFETLKITNANLIKQIAWQQPRIKELETSERVIVEQLTIPEQPIIYSVPVDTPQTAPETSYLDYIPYEMIIVVVGALELTRQVIMPRWNFN